jgi:hypothetical protein
VPIFSAQRNRFPTLTSFFSFVEPGGYLQWDEGNPSTTTAQSPRPQVSNKASSELLALIDRFSKLFQMNTASVALSECAVWTVLLTWETWQLDPQPAEDTRSARHGSD